MWHRDDGSQALHRDALGSIVATTDGTGKLKSEIVYDAFGNITESTGQSANKFGYTGHQMDAETGLIYFQARYYDPQLGRFITQDPYEGEWRTPLSLHHYLYAYGNPTVYVDLNGYESIFANIDKAAEGCGAFSCAGWALAKGAYAAATFGFATVHDPVRDLYDEGQISGGQYAARGIGGGAAIVAVNVAGVAIGGVGASSVTSLGSKALIGAGVGGLTAGGTDATTQGINIAAGLQENYDVRRTVIATGAGVGFGGAAPLVGPIVGKVAATETVRKTAEAVNSAAQSVRKATKELLTRESGDLGIGGSRLSNKSVPAEQSIPSWKLTVGAKLDSDGDKIGHAFVSVRPPEGPAVTRGLWPLKSDGIPGFDNLTDVSVNAAPS
ncbi:RHS repeat-associated core domain-containing protein [Duganella sp. Root336D2]|uniref:RHS repeat-associated core domain-containing protein n=1 Tax=Duganella sp. Root336D2 TaxID=1736518 RepID=UPI0035A28D01